MPVPGEITTEITPLYTLPTQNLSTAMQNTDLSPRTMAKLKLKPCWGHNLVSPAE